MNQDEIQMGTREGWGQTVPFSISLPDLRQHVYIIGKTGAGKTTLLRNMMIQLIDAGAGVGFIDPHGDLAEELLGCIPGGRIEDVVYFNPADVEFPIALNLLANVSKDERHLVASGIVGAFHSIWRDSWGPRMEYILYNALVALLECQNTSLLGVNRMLTDEGYRAWVVRQVRDPYIKEFWEHEYSSYDARFQREAIAPIQNKLGQFLLNPIIRNILGQVKCKVSFPFVIDNRRLFVANLSKGRIGHDKADLLGSLLVTQFQLAAMHRASLPEEDRKDFYLFIDEFQNFTTDAFASLLSEARKYRLSLILSHQHVEQLQPAIRQAVFGNAGTLISFRVGFTDAEVLQNEFGRVLEAQQFVDLERFEIIARPLENGKNTTFAASTLKPLAVSADSRQRGLHQSRRKFSVPREQVEARLNHLPTTSSSGTSLRKQQNHRSAAPSRSPKSSSESATRKTRRYPGVILPI